MVLQQSGHRSGRRRWAALLSGAVLTATVAWAVPDPTPANAAPILNTPITALPFFGSGTPDGIGTGSPGTLAGNTAVSERCNDGNPIVAPQWYGLGKKVTGQVYVRSAAWWTPRNVDYLATGSAIVDHWSGKVLSCGSTPLARTGRAVDVVGFYRSQPDPDMQNLYGDRALQIYVGRTTGRRPSNDHQSGARVVRSLPFSDTVDTAFADAFDEYGQSSDVVALRNGASGCYQGILSEELASVWYRYTPAITGPAPTVTLTPSTAWASRNELGNTLQSGISEITPEGSMVLPGPDGCNGVNTLQAGHTYYIGVATYNDHWSYAVVVPGGPLRVDITAAKPA